ncbi:hypothetical protein EJB05_56105, partial [Eragrostis curvula]
TSGRPSWTLSLLLHPTSIPGRCLPQSEPPQIPASMRRCGSRWSPSSSHGSWPAIDAGLASSRRRRERPHAFQSVAFYGAHPPSQAPAPARQLLRIVLMPHDREAAEWGRHMNRRW